jgi:uncharacterized membrane protein (DUF106 family)
MMEHYSTYAFLAVIMSAVGYLATHTRDFNIWKLGLLAFIVGPIITSLDDIEGAIWVAVISFFVGYLLPHAHILQDFFSAISSLINSIRYRNDKRMIDVKQEELRRKEEELYRREEELEKLRREYEEAMRDARQSQREYEEARSRYEHQSGHSGGEEQQKQQRQKQQESSEQKHRSKQRSRSDSKSKSKSRSSSYSGSKSTRTTHLETLGLDPSTQYTTDQIKKWQRKLASKYHPDKHHGKSEEEIRRLTEEMQKINEAADWLKKHPDQ